MNSNIQALSAATNLNRGSDVLAKSLARLSSGANIASLANNAAGVEAASHLDSQIKRTDAAKTNVSNAISFTQRQDRFLNKVAKALDRMSELSLLAQDATKGDSDRALYNTEYAQLSAYIANTATKDFNGVSLFSASTLNVALDAEGKSIAMTGVDLGLANYAGALGAGVATTTAALAALDLVKTAINQLASDRATIGAFQTRLNVTSEQLTVSKENLSAASSRNQDTEMADEATQYARYQVLVQSGTALLAQANAMPQTVLRLLP